MWTSSLEKLDLFHSMEVLFPEYFQSVSRIFPYHGHIFHTMELVKTIEIGFSNVFFFLYNISKIFPYYGRGPILSSGLYK